MNTLQTIVNERMNQTGYSHEKDFFGSDSIVFTKNGKGYLHTFNYLNQQYSTESYLELNDLCIQFNEQFQDESESAVTEEQKSRLVTN
ncbi:hypothetical protein [Chryseobacterium sp. SL1]|uniref:hypothetical protein n=1 Tax=Chryseobacterium sp. SL1 TaxID=2995159 RepID=UPI002274A362|nr:hypothetical protein [Chryseobacterium sp. SL1]MCY1660934.1 hypothetical protein [Chryseobacterium sp. SL1]